MNKNGFGIDNLQGLMCHETKPNQTKSNQRIKQFDGETSVMLELWGMQSTSSLLLLQWPLWPGLVKPDRVLSMGQIELSDDLN